MVKAIQSRGNDRLSVGVIAVEGVVFLVNFLKLMLGNKLGKSSIRSIRVGVIVGGAINGVFSEVEVTREDSVG